MELADWAYFFVKAAMSPAGWLCFVGALVGQAIGGAILIEKEIAVGFSGLSL